MLAQTLMVVPAAQPAEGSLIPLTNEESGNRPMAAKRGLTSQRLALTPIRPRIWFWILTSPTEYLPLSYFREYSNPKTAAPPGKNLRVIRCPTAGTIRKKPRRLAELFWQWVRLSAVQPRV